MGGVEARKRGLENLLSPKMPNLADPHFCVPAHAPKNVFVAFTAFSDPERTFLSHIGRSPHKRQCPGSSEVGPGTAPKLPGTPRNFGVFPGTPPELLCDSMSNAPELPGTLGVAPELPRNFLKFPGSLASAPELPETPRNFVHYGHLVVSPL